MCAPVLFQLGCLLEPNPLPDSDTHSSHHYLCSSAVDLDSRGNTNLFHLHNIQLTKCNIEVFYLLPVMLMRHRMYLGHHSTYLK